MAGSIPLHGSHARRSIPAGLGRRIREQTGFGKHRSFWQPLGASGLFITASSFAIVTVMLLRSPFSATHALLAVSLLGLPAAPALLAEEAGYTPAIAPASPDAERAIAGFRIPEGMQGELAAAEPQLANPVAFTVTASGDVYVCETFRQQQGVEDNRGHMNWLLQDLQLASIEERIAMFRRFMGDEAARWETEHDRIRLLRDTDGDGVFDSDTVFADGFSNLEDGTGAGVLELDGSVYYTCIPKLWKLDDADGNGVAEAKTPLHHGYGVRVAFRGHDLHGLTVGPDGRLYFSIGDRGYNVITQEGSRLKRPNTGAVFRCFPDGSHLEVFAYGLRNPQELAFDNAGNLFTGDNNSDSGDQARWVYVVQDGDSGWRMEFQYLDDRGPWNRERIWYPWAADAETVAVQPASTLPPIANLGNGPSGLVLYPGTGLGDRYDDHFFLVDFRGGAANSGIWSFGLEPAGASFAVTDKHEFLWSILATDLDFAADGSLLVSDWVNGWDGEGKGRLYRFRDAAASGGLAQEVTRLLTSSLEELSDDALADLLSHVDRRVRQRAQFALVRGGAVTTLEAAARSANETVARHAIWGLWQKGLEGVPEAIMVTAAFHDLLTADGADAELSEESQAQILRVAADLWSHHGVASLPTPVRQLMAAASIRRLTSDNLRLAGFAAVAAGTFGEAAVAEDLLAMLDRLANTDPVARHQAVMGLVQLASRTPGLLPTLAGHLGSPGRLGVALAMRRLADPAIGGMLNDGDPLIVAEAARAINDEPIDAATPALADLLRQPGLAPPVLRRAANAAYRRGEGRDAEAVAAIAASPSTPEPIRLVAATMLKTWNATEPLDTVTGRWRPLPTRDVPGLEQVVAPVLPQLLAGPAALRELALEMAVAFEIRDLVPSLEQTVADASGDATTRLTAFTALVALSDSPQTVIEQGLGDASEGIRLAAIEALADRQPEAALPFLQELLAGDSAPAIQRALQLVQLQLQRKPAQENERGGQPPAAAEASPVVALLSDAFGRQQAGTLPEAALLELLEAAAAAEIPSLTEAVAAFRGTQQARSRDGEAPVELWSECLTGGDADRGRSLFFGGSAASCRRCHQVDGQGGDVGPQLSGIAATRDSRSLLESIVAPSAVIAKGFETVVILTADGVVVSGIVREETDDVVSLMTPAGVLVTIPVADIDERATGLSGMPADLGTTLTRREIRDLVAYLATLTAPPSDSH